MQILNAAQPFVSTLTLLICIAILVVAFRTLRRANKSVYLAEQRMEYLHEEQARLKAGREERDALLKELGTAKEQQLKADRERESSVESPRNLQENLEGRVMLQESEPKRDTNEVSYKEVLSSFREHAWWRK